jgi:hypothetical protein
MRSLFARARVRGFGWRFRQIHFVDSSMQGSPADAELFGGGGDVALGRGERLHDQFSLRLVQIDSV